MATGGRETSAEALPAAAQRVVLITGGSSGLGLATAHWLTDRGYRVYAGSRRGTVEASCASAVDEVRAPRGAPRIRDVRRGERVARGALVPLRLDVDEDASVRTAVDRVMAAAGRLDVVLNCAGIGLAGALEDTPVEAVRAMFETNLVGTHRVCRGVLPIMRRQGSGLIVNVGSMAGVLALPFQGIYAATKFALEGYSDALATEVRAFGVRVVLVQPGDFRTGFTAARRAMVPESSPYAAQANHAGVIADRDEAAGLDPDRFARLVERIIECPRPRARYVIGPASERLLMTLRHVLPAFACRWLMAHHFGLR